MRYTVKEFDDAVELILPFIKDSKEVGCEPSRPKQGRMVIEEFVISGDYDNCFLASKKEAYNIVIQAMRDLENHGQFQFTDWLGEKIKKKERT